MRPRWTDFSVLLIRGVLFGEQILNVIVFIFFFGSNVYSSLGGPSTGYYSQKET
jgi:hypothetical protein